MPLVEGIGCLELCLYGIREPTIQSIVSGWIWTNERSPLWLPVTGSLNTDGYLIRRVCGVSSGSVNSPANLDCPLNPGDISENSAGREDKCDLGLPGSLQWGLGAGAQLWGWRGQTNTQCSLETREDWSDGADLEWTRLLERYYDMLSYLISPLFAFPIRLYWVIPPTPPSIILW